MEERGSLLVVEFIKVLHVSEDDVLLVDDSWRNLLDSAGHFPQVGLHSGNGTQSTKHKANVFKGLLSETLLQVNQR